MFRKIAIGTIGGLAALILVAAIFLVRFDISRDDAVAQYANASSRFVTLPSGAVAHVRDQGNKSGQTIVLVHGMNGFLDLWEPWVARLGKEFRIVTLDLPGHGLTISAPTEDFSPESLTAFVDEVVVALNLRDIVVGGNSLGGEMAWIYAIHHPEKIRGLVLLDSGGLPFDESVDLPVAFQLAQTPFVNKLMHYVTPRSAVEDIFKDVFWDDQLITSEMIDQTHRLMLVEGNREATVKIFQVFQPEATLIDRMSEITVPTLILWGAEDTLIPVQFAARFDDLIPNSKVVVLPNVGHLPMVEAPDVSAAIMTEFFRTLDISS